ncbi:hypothetical protein HDU97_006550 [Phlyctochytrium planicorne]|nr:hypothetical protein HDU97_006550 [Phlyctochytrium planicorne]
MSAPAAVAPAAEPALPQNAPYGVDLVPGKDYYFCSCGQSKNQPFCDGSHKGTAFKPLKFTVDEAKKYWLCGCKLTENAPFCDGTHRKEKGLKRYTEFLLKKNGELKAALKQTENARNFGLAVGVVGVLAAVGVLVGFEVLKK